MSGYLLRQPLWATWQRPHSIMGNRSCCLAGCPAPHGGCRCPWVLERYSFHRCSSLRSSPSFPLPSLHLCTFIKLSFISPLGLPSLSCRTRMDNDTLWITNPSSSQPLPPSLCLGCMGLNSPEAPGWFAPQDTALAVCTSWNTFLSSLGMESFFASFPRRD